MKFLVLLCIALFVQIAKLQEEEATSCLKEVNLEEDELNKIIGGDGDVLPEDNAQLEQFLNCFFKKRGFQNEQGEINFNNIIPPLINRFGSKDEKINEEIQEEILDICKNVTSAESHGQIGIKTFNCLTQNVQRLARKQKEQ